MMQSVFKNSIRLKLCLFFIAIVAGLQGFFLLFNSQALEWVLVYGDQREMMKLLDQYQIEVASVSALDGDAQKLLLGQLAYEWDGNLSFIDSLTGTYLSTVPMRGMRGGMMDQRGNLSKDVVDQFSALKPGEVASKVRKDRNGKEALVIYVGKINETQYIFSEKPLNVLHESENLVSRYLMISGFFTVMIGALIIWLLSKKLTQPIIEIEAQANRIAAQKFGSPNQVAQNDEIGSLGVAVNQIESALSEAIGALNEANDKLKDEIENERRLEQLRRLFVSNVSHELKTPMSMIIGYADGLKYGIANNADSIQYYCDVILSESEKMNTLINDLLDMSAYQEGRLPIQLKATDLSALVGQAAELYANQAVERSLQLTSEIASDCIVSGDGFRLEQVLRNLMSNAFKHVRSEGELRLTLEREGQTAVLTVFNEGAPIREDELEAIWMSFYRGSLARENQIDGFGIGLALVKEIVLKHNGTVAVENVQSGVAFKVKLPLLHDRHEEDYHGSI